MTACETIRMDSEVVPSPICTLCSSGEVIDSVHLLHQGWRTRIFCPLVRLVEGEERWEAPDHPQGVLPLNWGETELNHSVTCMVLKSTANDRCHLALCHDEFRGPWSGLCRSGSIGNNNRNKRK
ncbi:uncharacterized protein TNCV_2415871 [Trichonephila clavipes]|nr:uncharacterized protein TNCV_2415871 [Trichonephila clavipes]